MSITSIKYKIINSTSENVKFLNYNFVDSRFEPNNGKSLQLRNVHLFLTSFERYRLEMLHYTEYSVTFRRTLYRHITFKDCNFTDTNFNNVQTLNTKFQNCRFTGVQFNNTDIRGKNDPKFSNCIFVQSQIINSQACAPTKDLVSGDAAFWEYLVALIGSMSALPGLIACGFMMGRIGRINMLCTGLFTSLIIALLVPLSQKADAALLTMLCLFSGLLVPAWSAIHVLTVETFPTDRWATALGIGLDSLMPLYMEGYRL